MQNQSAQTVKNDGTFCYLLLLTGFFSLLEISFFIQCNKDFLEDFTFVADVMHIPYAVLPGILFYLLAQLVIHLGYCLTVWIIAELISKFFLLSGPRKVFLSILLWLLGIVTILASNQHFFPNSKFADLSNFLLPEFISNHLWIAFTLICGFCVLIAVIEFINTMIRQSMIYFLVAIVILTPVIVWLCSPKTLPIDHASAEKPNIILVGVDSLRPDFLSYFGSEKSTPFFDSFLNQAFVFSEAITPLARTFPSWSSVLMGKYPREIGIRYDLSKHDQIDFSASLPSILAQNGYETIFATDETRFSNVDKPFKFDHIIGPPTGLNDFLLGTLNDFPLSNLLVNTVIGHWLFPYSYANRPVYFTYQPQSFIKSLEPILLRERQKPLFLAIHFCLPHYPYLWGNLRSKNLTVRERYAVSVVEADQQINEFFVLLKHANILQHAIVVLFSDHGEALEFSGDRITESDSYVDDRSHGQRVIPQFYPPGLDHEEVNQSAGHGSDVLGLPQYHSLLAFRWYGFKEAPMGLANGVVSLIDIKPTLLDILRLPQQAVSGLSLMAVMHESHGEEKRGQSRHIFLESDYTPESIRTVYPETRKVILEGVRLYQVDPISTRLTVKPNMGEMIINSKQYADIYGEWMLALYPMEENVRIPILINLTSGKWTNDLQTSFARQSPAVEMLQALKDFYGEEIKTIAQAH